MKFPETNKIRKTIDDSIGSNAKLLETWLNATNWRLLGKYYAVALLVVLSSVWISIVVIRSALTLF